MTNTHRLIGACLFAVVALVGACDSGAGGETVVPAGGERQFDYLVIEVGIHDRTYELEVADTLEKREVGLAGRTSIDEKGGMLFTHPENEKQVQYFWMKGCLTDMDILFIDDSGRIVKWHEMKAEPPRGEDESERAYENRLKRYTSGFPVRIAIELAPGQLRELRESGLREGDKVDVDLERLKAMAK
ncbi:DUF192 domain-containing protein [Pyruvatibacter sp.]|uniref:DUF192 domain-containing protein n=1 Tax=Pyruvatibacter sp. TaxID=1981328 RepID=UPI0032ED18B6